MSLKRTRVVPAVNGEVVADVSDDLILGSFPTIAEFLTRVRWQDGEERETGTITLSFEDHVFKAAVNDRDAGNFAYVSAATLGELFTLIDAGLDAGNLPWRVSKWTKKKKEGGGGGARKP